jgi:hypothetical protein
LSTFELFVWIFHFNSLSYDRTDAVPIVRPTRRASRVGKCSVIFSFDFRDIPLKFKRIYVSQYKFIHIEYKLMAMILVMWIDENLDEFM